MIIHGNVWCTTCIYHWNGFNWYTRKIYVVLMLLILYIIQILIDQIERSHFFKKYTNSVWSNCWILYHQSSWFGSLWKSTLFKGQYTCIILARFCLVQIIGISRVKIWWRCTFKHPTYQGNNQNEQGQLIS